MILSSTESKNADYFLVSIFSTFFPSDKIISSKLSQPATTEELSAFGVSSWKGWEFGAASLTLKLELWALEVITQEPCRHSACCTIGS